MKKNYQIDFSGDRLLSIAADMLDEHNYMGALKMLNKNAEMWGDDADSYMLYAETFDDMELNERCINYWFRFLDAEDFPDKDDLYDCYEGLAVAYMNAGMQNVAAYYYDKMLSEGDDCDEESRAEIIRTLLSVEENPLKIVYPPEEADCSEIINSGVKLIKSGDLKTAIEVLSEVEEGNEKFTASRNYITMCHIMNGDNDKAEEECAAMLSRHPDDVNALTNLAAIKIERATECEGSEKPEEQVKAAGFRAESVALAEKLLSLNCKDPDDMYRIGTVCCENNMHAEALKMFLKVAKERPYDFSLLYFIAVAAYNSGDMRTCYEYFDKLLTIDPHAVTARYFLNKARENEKEGKTEEMSYFYLLPNDMREESLKLMAAILKLSVAEARKLASQIDVLDILYWCLDGHDNRAAPELQSLGAEIAVKLRYDDIVRDILLDAFAPDEFKIRILTKLCERNEENSFGVVVCHMYKEVLLPKLNIGRLKRKNFVSAYASLVGHFSLIDPSVAGNFATASETLYAFLADKGKLALSDDDRILVAAIFNLSDSAKKLDIPNVSAFFGVSDEEIEKFLDGLH